MSLRWTLEQLEEYMARQKQPGYIPLSGHQGQIKSNGDLRADHGKESDLQAKIEHWCRERGFFFFHDRSRGDNARGMPDLVIALRNGRVLWLELKSARGRLRPEQKRVRLMLLQLGQEWHEIRSFRQFVEVVNHVS